MFFKFFQLIPKQYLVPTLLMSGLPLISSDSSQSKNLSTVKISNASKDILFNCEEILEIADISSYDTMNSPVNHVFTYCSLTEGCKKDTRSFLAKELDPKLADKYSQMKKKSSLVQLSRLNEADKLLSCPDQLEKLFEKLSLFSKQPNNS